MKTHEVERIRFQCDKCFKDLSTLSNLKSHTKRVHMNIKFPCETCGKTYSDKGDLKRHH